MVKEEGREAHDEEAGLKTSEDAACEENDDQEGDLLMPLTDKGQKIMSAMKQQYGDKKGEGVFYASRNKGTISGVDPESKKRKPPPRRHKYPR